MPTTYSINRPLEPFQRQILLGPLPPGFPLMLFFNLDHGYLEAILRGFKSGLISRSQYTNFTQCESLEDMRLQLTSATDYGEYLQEQTGSGPLKPSLIGEQVRAKFVQDFRYLRSNATGDLATFLDYITYQYMIDNVVLIMTGVMKGEELDREELMSKCHPLGILDLMPALTLSRSLPDLYTTILLETPIGPYFQSSEILNSNEGGIEGMNVELVRLALGKAYLEDFYKWCTTVADDVTKETMGEILSFEADRRTMNIAINAISSGVAKNIRLSLFPAIGSLYDAGIAEQLSNCDDLSQLRNLIESTNPSYRSLLDAAINASSSNKEYTPSPGPSGQSFESLASEREVELCKESFLRQFCLTPFYAWVRLREQEERNIVWIAECIAQKQKENIHSYIPIW